MSEGQVPFPEVPAASEQQEEDSNEDEDLFKSFSDDDDSGGGRTGGSSGYNHDPTSTTTTTGSGSWSGVFGNVNFSSDEPPTLPDSLDATVTAGGLILPSVGELDLGDGKSEGERDGGGAVPEDLFLGPNESDFTPSGTVGGASLSSASSDPDITSQVVGIDLGTTFSCVSVWENGRPTVIANNMGNRTTPSWVSFQSGNVFVGEAARSKGSRSPKTTIYDAKRMIGRKLADPQVQQSIKLWPFKVTEHRGNCAVQLDKNQVLMPEEISAYVLAKMKHTAEDYLGHVRRAVVTVPAYFNDAQRQATIDACSIAGLKVERIINEPTAAALAYGLERNAGEGKAQTLLIYDLGGGTLDVTIMVVDGGVFEVKSTSGDTHLGGQDFDNNLVRYFLHQVEEMCGEDISNNLKAMKKLRDACQTLKHNLSHSDSATIEVDELVNGEDFDSSLTRDQFVDINKDLFDHCIAPIERALNDAHLSRNDIDEVILIGGSTRIVRIQQLLEKYFPTKPLSKRINPDEAVAMGAAIQGANLSLSFEQKSPKLAGITLMDVTPMSLGIELVGGKMSILIQRNTTIPYSHTRVYKNNEDYQTKAIVEVFEGEDRYTKSNRLLGRFTLPGLPPRLRGQVYIPVTFTLDANGVLEVQACVKGEAGSTKTLVIQKDKGLLTQDEIASKAKLLSKWERSCRVNKLN